MEQSIILEGVSKKFKIGCKDERKTALANVVSFFSGREVKKDFWAIKDINLAVGKGEKIGLIGKNGSGKSTLLRIIAGVYEPTSGKVKTEGNVLCVLGLGQGLNYKLTMRENIFLMGSILGLTQKNVKKKFSEIVEFSGLKEFLDTKVYQFSSGMVIRLNFSVMIHCLHHARPDILLLDEVFGSGGDFDFDQRAIKKMEEFVRGGATVVMASHDLEKVKNNCSKVLCLDKGSVVKCANAEEAIKYYEQSIGNNSLL